MATPYKLNDTVKKIRADFKRGLKVSAIVDKYKDAIADGCSRHTISLIVHNHTYVDALYGKWLSGNVRTRYTKEPLP